MFPDLRIVRLNEKLEKKPVNRKFCGMDYAPMKWFIGPLEEVTPDFVFIAIHNYGSA